MSKRVKYVMNNKSFGQFIMSEQALKPTREVGRSIIRYARHISPRSGDGKGKPYADSFELRPKPEGLVAGKYKNRRVAVTIVNTAPHAPVVEYGSALGEEGKLRPGHRVMLRAGAVYGDAPGLVNQARWGG